MDYRQLNKVTTPEPYSMPLIDELLHRVGEATYFSKLDLLKGFYQVPLEAKDMEKTAFISPAGKFQFTKMPFGLKNTPATFQMWYCRDLNLFQSRI